MREFRALAITIFFLLFTAWSTALEIHPGGAVKVVQGEAKLQTLTVSPDGNFLAYSSAQRDQKGDIVLYSLKTGRKQNLPISDSLESQPVFSPDMKYLYFFSNEKTFGGIYRISLPAQAAPISEQISPPDYWCEFPTISPNGKTLVYYSRRNGNYNLYKMDIETRKEDRLTAPGSFDFGPVFSSDGKKIFFYSNRTGQFAVHELTLAGNQIRLLNNPDGFTFQPSSDYKNSFLFAVSNAAGNNDLYILPLSESGKPQRLTKDPSQDMYPALFASERTVFFISNRDGSYAIYKIVF